jgi:hypothetical protein
MESTRRASWRVWTAAPEGDVTLTIADHIILAVADLLGFGVVAAFAYWKGYRVTKIES